MVCKTENEKGVGVGYLNKGEDAVMLLYMFYLSTDIPLPCLPRAGAELETPSRCSFEPLTLGLTLSLMC